MNTTSIFAQALDNADNEHDKVFLEICMGYENEIKSCNYDAEIMHEVIKVAVDSGNSVCSIAGRMLEILLKQSEC